MTIDTTRIVELQSALLNDPADNAAYSQLIEMLIPEAAPTTSIHADIPRDYVFRLHDLVGSAFQLGGFPSLAVPHYQRCAALAHQRNDMIDLPPMVRQLHSAALESGQLALAESCVSTLISIYQSVGLSRQTMDTQNGLAYLLMMRGEYAAANQHMDTIMDWYAQYGQPRWAMPTLRIRARTAFWQDDTTTAAEIADVAWEFAYHSPQDADQPPAPGLYIGAAQLQAEIALAQGDLALAETRLMTIFTDIKPFPYLYTAEQIALFTALGSLAQSRQDIDTARQHFATAAALSHEREYPVQQADLRYALAQLEQDLHQHAAAIEAATGSYLAAWCDGISADGTECYAYRRGLDRAAALLTNLGAPIPTPPPFDASLHGPLR